MSTNTTRNRITLAAMAVFAAAAAILAPALDSAGDQTLARKAGGEQLEYLVIRSS